ncbi:MAG: hypothetical protein VB876_13585 [Pirellulales bacterium]
MDICTDKKQNRCYAEQGDKRGHTRLFVSPEMTAKCFLTVAAASALILVGCSPPVQDKAVSTELSKWVGQNVKIRFRGDALGAGDRPIDPDTGEINGVSTGIVGKLVAVSASGVVIERYMIISKTEKEHWVPREVILFIQVDP